MTTPYERLVLNSFHSHVEAFKSYSRKAQTAKAEVAFVRAAGLTAAALLHAGRAWEDVSALLEIGVSPAEFREDLAVLPCVA